jgi:hypothetical protein
MLEYKEREGGNNTSSLMLLLHLRNTEKFTDVV